MSKCTVTYQDGSKATLEAPAVGEQAGTGVAWCDELALWRHSETIKEKAVRMAELVRSLGVVTTIGIDWDNVLRRSTDR